MRKFLYRGLALALLGFAAVEALTPALTQTTGSVTNHAIPVGRGPGVVGFGVVSPGTSGWVLTYQGTGSDPVWAPSSLVASGFPLTRTNDTNVTMTLTGNPTQAVLAATGMTLGWTGTLAVSRGGTGTASGVAGGIPYYSASTTISSTSLLTNNGIMLGGGTNGPSSTTAMTDAQLLIGRTGLAPAPQTVAGDVTINVSGTTTISATAVTNAKLANVATQTFKGRTTAGTGSPEDLTVTQATAMLNNFVGDSGAGGTKGLVPAPASGDAAAGRFLAANGTWSVPPGSGGGGSSGSGVATFPQGRCTLSSSTAITTSDMSGGVSLWYLPSSGPYVPITNNGTTFTMSAFTARAQTISDTTKSPGAVAANSIYDYFMWDDAGTVRFSHGPAWTSDTGRGTGAGTSEIDFSTTFPTNKVAITNGPGAGRGTLLCSARANSAGELMDTQLFRWVSNAWNTVSRFLAVTYTAPGSGNWTYSAGTFQQANNVTTNQVDILQTLTGGLATARVGVNVSSDTTCGATAGIGVSNSTVNSANLTIAGVPLAGQPSVQTLAFYSGYPGFGRNTLRWLENGGGCGGTRTWIGNNGTGLIGPGLTGEIPN